MRQCVKWTDTHWYAVTAPLCFSLQNTGVSHNQPTLNNKGYDGTCFFLTSSAEMRTKVIHRIITAYKRKTL